MVAVPELAKYAFLYAARFALFLQWYSRHFSLLSK
jgi:hypothetical protein